MENVNEEVIYEENVKGQIERLLAAKTEIKNAIETCGVEVPDTALIDDYDTYITAIPTRVLSELDLTEKGGDDKYIKTISQTDGVISATEGGLASSSSSGLMSKADKIKLDGISDGAKPGTVTSITPGTGLTRTNDAGTAQVDTAITTAGTINLKAASTTELGGIQIANKRTTTPAPALTIGGTTASRYYGVELDSNNKAFVNVPWTKFGTITFTAGTATDSTGDSVAVVTSIPTATGTTGTSVTTTYTTKNVPTLDVTDDLKDSIDELQTDLGNLSLSALKYVETIAGGGVDPGTFTPKASKGDVYIVNRAGKINGVTVEVGDAFVCTADAVDRATSSNYTTIQSSWRVLNTNWTVDNKNATIGSSLTTIATVGGVDIKAKIVDNNTTYTVTTGDNNGQIKVTPSSGDAYDVNVKGLGGLAYKDKITASTDIDGIIPVANGGTGLKSITSGCALIGSGTSAVSTRAITNNKTSKVHITPSDNLITANTLAYWNGAYNTSNASNLTYCNKGAFGDAVICNLDYTTSEDDRQYKIEKDSDYNLYTTIPWIAPNRNFTSGLQISSHDGPGTAYCALYVPYATENQSGVVSTTDQTFGGAKTFNGAMTVYNTITFGGSDSYGLRTSRENYVTIGESGKAFYKSYINSMYTNNIRVNGTAGSIGETGKRFTYGYFSQSVRATNGFYEESDERLKQILEPIKINFNDLSKLRKIYYLWKDNPGQGQQLGVIAQDIQKLYPELVDEDSETGLLSVAYDKLSVVALAAVDKLHEEIGSLQKKNIELEDRISKLENILLYGKEH